MDVPRLSNMGSVSRFLRRLPRGVPQALGALTALLLFRPLAALHVHVVSFEVNWTYFITFIGLNALIALYTVWRASEFETRSRRPQRSRFLR